MTIKSYLSLFIAHGRDGAQSLLPGAKHRWFSIGLLTFWLAGLLGDAVTTSLAIRSGIAREANPVSNMFFNYVGMEVWMAIGVIVMTMFAFLTLRMPSHKFMYPLVFSLPALLFVKLFITGNNLAVLWVGGAM